MSAAGAKRKGRGCGMGRRGSAGWAAWAGHVRALALEEKEGRCPGWFAGRGKRERERERGPTGPKREKGGGERGEGFSFFKILFKFIFQTFKLHSNKKSCIRIMMHKHLLFSNFINMMFNYFKGQFYFII
jgi:hypothetical protein